MAFTDLDLLAELQAYAPPGLSIRRDGGVTATEDAKAQGFSRRTARIHLNKLVDDGILLKERCKTATGSEFVYYKA